MTAPAHIVEIVTRTRAEQGLPPRITDPVVLRQVAELMRVPGGEVRDDAAA